MFFALFEKDIVPEDTFIFALLKQKGDFNIRPWYLSHWRASKAFTSICAVLPELWLHELLMYSKTSAKRPLKNRQNKRMLMTNGSLMQIKSIESHYLVFLRVAVLHRFYCK